MLDPEQYADTKPLDPEEMLAEMSELQEKIDRKEDEKGTLQNEVKALKEAIEGLHGKMAVIARASGEDRHVYRLRGGELTTEAPDLEGRLPFSGPRLIEDDDPLGVETPAPAAAPVEVKAPVEEKATAGTPGPIASCVVAGEEAILSQDSDGLFWVRWGGKPLASGLKAAWAARASATKFWRGQFNDPDFTAEWGPVEETPPWEKPAEEAPKAEEPAKKKRGRPRKVKPEPDVVVEDLGEGDLVEAMPDLTGGL